MRDAEDADLAEIQLIYAHHVATGPGSFEEIPPDLAEIDRGFGGKSAGCGALIPRISDKDP